MSQYLNNSDAYTLITEKELAVLLSTFNSQYIFDITVDKLKDKYNSSFNLTKPNVVESFEQTFKNLLNQYPMDRENILDTREEVYKEIIRIEFNIHFNFKNKGYAYENILEWRQQKYNWF